MTFEDHHFVKAKKHLGQHFLTDKNIAAKIANSLPEYQGNMLEIGPGMGILTEFLSLKYEKLKLVELDTESVDFLIQRKTINKKNIIEADFLKLDLSKVFTNEPFGIIGNFPYNISSQIVFKTLENRNLIPALAGMFQKEVAERIAMPPGSKLYGILSVLCQAFYNVKYLFSVPPTVFNPPPNVVSGVISMVRKKNYRLRCDEDLFFKIVKMAFNTRRKMLRSSLKPLIKNPILVENEVFTMRPEQLSYKDFEELTSIIQGQEE